MADAAGNPTHDPTQAKLTRRSALGVAASALAAPTFIPATALGRDGATAPANRVTMALIGCGGMGNGNMNVFLGFDDVQVLAGCDVDRAHLNKFVAKVNDKYGNRDCAGYSDFREVAAREDIDAVCVATPDHWHGLTALACVNAGKDVYGEKPITHTFTEGRLLADAVAAKKRVWQTGSWQRSVGNFQAAVNFVREGRIGRVRRVQVGLPYGNRDWSPEQRAAMFATKPPPEELDYDFWTGPAKMLPYCEARVHSNWRWNLNTGGGQLMDWIGHHNDIAHWGVDKDYDGPVEVHASGYFPPADAVWNAPPTYHVQSKYADGLEITIRDAPRVPRGESGRYGYHMGVKWIGDDGWIYVARGRFETSDPAWAKEPLPRPADHRREFINAVKTRGRTSTPAEIAHRSITPGHLGYVSMALGRKLRWNPKEERIIDDPSADALLRKTPMRSPWTLKG